MIQCSSHDCEKKPSPSAVVSLGTRLVNASRCTKAGSDGKRVRGRGGHGTADFEAADIELDDADETHARFASFATL